MEQGQIGVVTNYLFQLIAKQVEDHRLVVWYDPEGAYTAAAAAFELPNTTVARYDSSFFQLRRDIDSLLNDVQQPRLVVYVPEDRDKTDHALIELEAAGVVIQPAQQPPTRNTRLAIVARNALKSILGDETAAEIEKQVDAGKLSLADLNALADKGKDISTGVLSLIFGTSTPQEVALAFLNSDKFDNDVEQKSARPQLLGLLRNAFEIDLPESTPLAEVRQRLAPHVLLTEFITGLGEATPPSLGTIKIASALPTREACIGLAHAWRLRRDVRDSYVVTAKQVEQTLGPSSFVISPSLLETKDNEPRTIDHLETFLAIERALMQHVEHALLQSTDWIEALRPIQIATFDLEEYCNCRRQFTSEEWIDLLLRSIGLEPHHFSRRLKLLLLSRLLPLCEANYNLVELGPRGTGKSYAYQELSPYTILLTGPTTVANLFYNMATNKMGLVGIWDAIAFDEVADLQKMPKEVITTLKTYGESGSFARGKESLTGMASLAMFGNTNQPVEVMVRSSHLFLPMPDVIREDMAFFDRIHFYLPGWEIPKMRVEFFTEHYGFVVDYLAEALRELRKHNYTELLDRYFSLGSHLNARDVKAVRKTVSGLVKLLYPHGDVSKEDLAELVEMALEGRRRVKEQLKKMGSFEYHQTSFSYLDRDTLEERFVGVPEQGGRDSLSPDPLAPGSVYTAAVDDQGKVGLYRLEVGCAPGTGKLRIAGGVDGPMKESLQRAFAYMMGHKVAMGIGQQIDTTDFHVEAIDLLSNHVPCEAGVALVIAIYSALKKHSVLPGLVILGDLSIQGNIKAAPLLTEPLQVSMDNGARRALIPLENKRHFLEVAGDIVERVDPIFFSDPMTAAMKALGMT